MRKRVVVFLVGLCIFIPVFSRSTVIGHATTNENRAVVSFTKRKNPPNQTWMIQEHSHKLEVPFLI